MNTLLHTTAPDISLRDQDGKEHKVSDYRGQYVLLYCYPKDMTPGCTTEACGFRDAMTDLQTAGVQVLGVSADSVESHKKFAEKYHLNFPLLADTEKKLITSLGVWKEKRIFGKIGTGISRESFLVDPQGVIVKHYPKVKPNEHPQEVLRDIEELK